MIQINNGLVFSFLGYNMQLPPLNETILVTYSHIQQLQTTREAPHSEKDIETCWYKCHRKLLQVSPRKPIQIACCSSQTMSMDFQCWLQWRCPRSSRVKNFVQKFIQHPYVQGLRHPMTSSRTKSNRFIPQPKRTIM